MSRVIFRFTMEFFSCTMVKKWESDCMNKAISVREMCAIGVFAAVISVCALVSTPMPNGVPMTLQTFAIPLAGIVLGKRNGVLAAVIYVLLGAAGVPVFHNMNGGFGVLLGPTGGFILSFPLMALTAAIGAGKNNSLWLVSWLTAGAVINYACGMLWFTAVTSNGLITAFLACVAPFLIMDTAKIIVVASLGKILKKVLKHHKKEVSL